MDRSTTVQVLADLLTRKFLLICKPELEGEELDDAVLEELCTRLTSARSLSSWEDLLSVIKDVDPEMEQGLFGDDSSDMIATFLGSKQDIQTYAFCALDCLLSYINIYPERIQADVDAFLKRDDLDEDELAEWQESEMAALIIGRRSDMLARLIADCVNPENRFRWLSQSRKGFRSDHH